MSRTETLPDCGAEGAARGGEHDLADLTAQELSELAHQAETDAAEAENLAAAARARAQRLRQGQSGVAGAVPRRHVSRRLRLGRRRIVALAALLCAAALLAVSGYMVKTQQDVQADQRNRAEFVAAAKQVVVTLMSIDFNNPQQSVQQIVDNSTDPFRAEFQRAADDFIKVAKDSKVTTTATANAAAVASVTADSAVVLVSASSTVTNEAGVNEEPRNWRLTVDLKREGDRIKMAKVEFVP